MVSFRLEVSLPSSYNPPATKRLQESPGRALLETTPLNKGTAFTLPERQALGSDGPLPPAVESIEEPSFRAYKAVFASRTISSATFIFGSFETPTKFTSRRCCRWFILRPGIQPHLPPAGRRNRTTFSSFPPWDWRLARRGRGASRTACFLRLPSSSNGAPSIRVLVRSAPEAHP